MADSDNTQELKLGVNQPVKALTDITAQVENLIKLLGAADKRYTGEGLKSALQLAKNASKEIQGLVGAYGQGLSTLDQKFNQTTQRINSSIEKTGTALGVQANQLRRAAQTIKDAASVKVAPNTGLEKSIATSVIASKELEASTRRVARLLAQIDAQRGYTGGNAGRRKVLEDLDAERNKASDLILIREQLIRSEKEEAIQVRQTAQAAATAARERVAAERAALQATRERLQVDRQNVTNASYTTSAQSRYYSTGTGRAQVQTGIAASQASAGDVIGALNAQRAAIIALRDESIRAYGGENEAAKAYSLQLVKINEELAVQKSLQRTTPEALARQSAERAAATRNRTIGAGAAGNFIGQASTLANYAVLGGALATGGEIIKGVVGLDEALHNLQAITDTTDTGMVSLRQTILTVSGASKFMATDVANAATILGQAGLSASQIGDSLKGVVTLAQGAGISLEEAVNLTTSAMGAFNLRADQSLEIANTLTAALNNSKLTIQQLSAGFQYAAPAAAQLGVSYQELATTMALMAQSGIRSGSMIGSGIRQILNQLSAPSTKFQQVLRSLNVSMDEVDVKQHGLLQVMQNLKDAGFSASEAFRAFGTRGAGAFIALSGQLGNADAMYKSIIGTQAAVKASDTQMQSLANTAKNLGAGIVSLSANAFGPLVTVLQGTLSAMASVTHAAQDMGIVFQLLGTAVALLAARSLGAYLLNLTALPKLMTAASAAITEFTAAVEFASIAGTGAELAISTLLGLFGPATLIIGGLTLAFVGLNYALNAHKEAEQAAAAAVEEATGKYEAAKQTYQAVITETQNLITKSTDLHKNHQSLGIAAEQLGEQFKSLGLDVRNVTGDYQGLLNKMYEMQGVALKAQLQAQIVLRDAQQKTLDQATQNSTAYVGAGLRNKLGTAGLTGSAIFGSTSGIVGDISSKIPNLPASVGQVIGKFGNSNAPITGQNASQLLNASQDLATLDISKFTEPQKQALSALRGVIDAMSASADTIIKSASTVVAANKTIQVNQVQQSPAFTALSKTVTQATSGMRATGNQFNPYGFPKSYGKDQVEDLKAFDQWAQIATKNLGGFTSQLQAFAKTSPKNAEAVKGLLQNIKVTQAFIADQYSQHGAAAKSQATTLAETALHTSEHALSNAEALLSSSKTVSAANDAYSKVVTNLTAKLNDEAQKRAAQLGLDSKQYTIQGGKIITKPGAGLSVSDQSQVDDGNNDVQNSITQYQQHYNAKIAELTTKSAKEAETQAEKDANQALQAQQKAVSQAVYVAGKTSEALLKSITDAFKDVNEYTSRTDIKADAQKALDKLTDWYAQQLALIAAKIQKAKLDEIEAAVKKYETDNPNATPAGIAAATTKATSEAVGMAAPDRQALFDALNSQAADKQAEIKDKTFNYLNSNTPRSPSQADPWGDVQAQLQKSFADPRASQSSVNQFAQTFQDTMEAAIKDVRENMGQMFTDWEMGTKTAGEAFKAFGKSILTSMLSAINNQITQQFLSLVGLATVGAPTTPGSSSSGGTSGAGAAGSLLSKVQFSGGTDLFSSIQGLFNTADLSAADFSFARGGRVKNYAYGGPVSGSIGTRDSVYRPVKGGDFIMRQAATRAIGLPTLNRINAMASGGTVAKLMPGEYHINGNSASAFGYDALSKLNFAGNVRSYSSGGGVHDMLGSGVTKKMNSAGALVSAAYGDTKMPKGQAHNTNVYVVAPNEQPPTTPNDIVVAISNDILKNGVTKKLIQTVAAGG